MSSQNLLKERLIIPSPVRTNVENKEIQNSSVVELNTEPTGYKIITLEGVNGRGKTTLAKSFASQTGYQIVKEPPYLNLEGQDKFTWYDILVKGELDDENYLLGLYNANKALVQEILINSGIKKAEDQGLSKLEEIEKNPSLIKFWGFVFSRLCLKNDLLRKSKLADPGDKKILIGDRNALTTIVFNLCPHYVEEFNDEILMQAIQVYAYLGENNYIPISDHTLAITSEEGVTFESFREGDKDVNDGFRYFQETIYRKVLDLRKKREYDELLAKFLGRVWHIEMSHIPPYQDRWELSLDSEIMLKVLREIDRTGAVPDFISLSNNSEIVNKLSNVYTLVSPSQPLHVTGDFQVVVADSEMFIKCAPEFLRPETDDINRHLFWDIAGLPDWTAESPDETKLWFTSLIRSLLRPEIKLFPENIISSSPRRLTYDDFKANSFGKSLGGLFRGGGYEQHMAVNLAATIMGIASKLSTTTPELKSSEIISLSLDPKAPKLTPMMRELSLLENSFGPYFVDPFREEDVKELLMKGTKRLKKVHLTKVLAQTGFKGEFHSPVPKFMFISGLGLEFHVRNGDASEVAHKIQEIGNVGLTISDLISLFQAGVLIPESLLIYYLSYLKERPKVRIYKLDLLHHVLSKHLTESNFYPELMQKGLIDLSR